MRTGTRKSPCEDGRGADDHDALDALGDVMSVAAGADGNKDVRTPLSDADVQALKAGDRVRISGVIYTARDAAHGRLLPLIEKGERLPIDVKGQIIYYTGPSPARPGTVIGSVGPTTASRMDKFTPALLALGLKGTIGKGYRGQPVKDALRQHVGVYFGSIGGAGAVLSEFVKKAEVVAYEDLGTEAIRRLEVEHFPAIVLYDCHGGDLYRDGQKVYAREADG
jgi:fumarate hydratase subunit beta